MKNMKKMIISPHIDDDVLGCGGIIDKNTFVLYCGVDEFHIISKEDRLKEADKVKNYLGHSYTLLNKKVNHYKVQDLIDSFQKHINSYKPDVICIPHPSYNQDHKVVYDAAMIATRPHDNNYFVKKVLLYEQPQVYLWNTTNREFKANYFVPVEIERKIKAYELMESQVRDFRSPELIRNMGMVRAKQVGRDGFAEAFEILRWVD
jgi:LmbE family N-acetylglucosaminyl deacetylase|tara:strand:- start:1178 stop:1792 length:615 start_codon:yes stop_codon:yes gene_type:complete